MEAMVVDLTLAIPGTNFSTQKTRSDLCSDRRLDLHLGSPLDRGVSAFAGIHHLPHWERSTSSPRK